MGKEFKSIIIPDTILIVENGSGQGYIVPKGNENILNTAKEWAKHFKYGEGETWKKSKKKGIGKKAPSMNIGMVILSLN